MGSIKEELFNSGNCSTECLSIQALLNRYTKATQIMRSQSTVVPDSYGLGTRQRERTVEFIMQLLLANNGDPSFRVPLSTASMKAAKEYIEHGGEPENGTDSRAADQVSMQDS